MYRFMYCAMCSCVLQPLTARAPQSSPRLPSFHSGSKAGRNAGDCYLRTVPGTVGSKSFSIRTPTWHEQCSTAVTAVRTRKECARCGPAYPTARSPPLPCNTCTVLVLTTPASVCPTILFDCCAFRTGEREQGRQTAPKNTAPGWPGPAGPVRARACMPAVCQEVAAARLTAPDRCWPRGGVGKGTVVVRRGLIHCRPQLQHCS